MDDHFSSIANDHDSSSHLSTTPTEFSNLDYFSALSKVIKHSVPTLQFPQLEPKTSARILTSEENRRILREKEKEKLEEEALKEDQKEKRELKKATKLKDKQEKHKQPPEGAQRLKRGVSYSVIVLYSDIIPLF